MTSDAASSKAIFDRMPRELRSILEHIQQAGHHAWLVGGAIRDHLLGLAPKDWDLSTTARPEQIMKLFPRVIPIGIRHGTVRVHSPSLDVEVTSIPGDCPVAEALAKDLQRRDFTINAVALSFPDGFWHDPFHGRRDLKAGRLRATQSAPARFQEDPLRTLRAARFVSVYGLHLAHGSFTALREASPGLAAVARERIRDEVHKLLLGRDIWRAFDLMRRGRILQVILPEILEGHRKRQGPFHCYDIYGHIVHTIANSPLRLRVRLAALFHDIAKPRVRKKIGGSYKFYGHAKLSAQMAADIMGRWRMPMREIQAIVRLVENHLLTDTANWSNAAVRRLIARVSPELVDDLLDLAYADRQAQSPDISSPQQIDTLRTRIAQQLSRHPPLRIQDLRISGHDVMQVLGIPPGPKVGAILRALHREILKHPEYNERPVLLRLIQNDFLQQ